MKPYYKLGSRGYYCTYRGKQTHLLTGEETEGNHKKALKAMKQKCFPFDTKLGSENSLRAFASLYCEQLHYKSESHTSSFRKRILKFAERWKKLKVEEILPFHATQYASEQKAWVSPWSVAIFYKSLQAWFNWGLTRGLIRENPFRGKLKLPKCAGRPPECMVTEEEYDKLLEAAGREGKRLLKVLWITGCRPVEMRRVRKHNYQKTQKAWVFADEQSKVPRRIIYLTPELIDITETMIERGRDWLFYDPFHKRPFTEEKRRDLIWWFKRVKRKAGIDRKDLTLYSFRHKWITDALLKGLNSLTVAKLAGTSLAMIEKHYGHLVQPEPMVQRLMDVRG